MNALRRRIRRPARAPKVPPLSARERVVVVLVLINLMTLSWCNAGHFLWTQWTSFGISVLTFLMLFVPMGPGGHFVPRSQTPAESWRILRALPVFWVGLVLMAFVIIQGLNPEWVYTRSGNEWWMTRRASLGWLPSGMEAPWTHLNHWRWAMVMASVWLSACALWVCLNRRRAVRILAWGMALNFGLWALLAIIQHQLEVPRMLWVYETASIKAVRHLPTGEAVTLSRFFGAMVNKNHAAAFLNLGLALNLSLYLYYFQRHRHELAKGGPHLLFLSLGALCAIASGLALSRAALLATALMMALFLGLVVVQFWRLYRETGGVWSTFFLPGVLIAGLLIGVVWIGGRTFKPHELFGEVDSLRMAVQDPMTESRPVLYATTVRMWQDRWFTGWGAGSFRYAFPFFQQHEPRLQTQGWLPLVDPDSGRLTHRPVPAFFTHAHNDYLQWLAELGVMGFLLWMFLPAYAVYRFAFHARQRPVSLVFLMVSILIVSGHAMLDFVFSAPAILASAMVMVVFAARWSEWKELPG